MPDAFIRCCPSNSLIPPFFCRKGFRRVRLSSGESVNLQDKDLLYEAGGDPRSIIIRCSPFSIRRNESGALVAEQITPSLGMWLCSHDVRGGGVKEPGKWRNKAIRWATPDKSVWHR